MLASPAYDAEEALLRSLALARQDYQRRVVSDAAELYKELENEEPPRPKSSKTLRGQRILGIIPGIIQTGLKLLGSIFNPQPQQPQPGPAPGGSLFG